MNNVDSGKTTSQKMWHVFPCHEQQYKSIYRVNVSVSSKPTTTTTSSHKIFVFVAPEFFFFFFFAIRLAYYNISNFW